MNMKESCSVLLLPGCYKGRRLLSGESYKKQDFTGGSNSCFSDDIAKITVMFLPSHICISEGFGSEVFCFFVC